MPGLDKVILSKVNPQVSIDRILHDIQTDFIWAPHLKAVFKFCGDMLWGRLRSDLRSGKYAPELPISIQVPKPGGFDRPGSILVPADRLTYQILADLAAPTVEEQLNRSRVFSNILSSESGSGAMFAFKGVGFKRMQNHIRSIAERGGYFLVGDIANYFERVPQHQLINLLRASDIPSGVINLLEELFLAFRERRSFGIVQGVYPSDLLGNFYLSHLDAHCETRGWDSARFVDDFYIHFGDRHEAERGLSGIINTLRSDGLHLNEAKSGIKYAEDVIWEETELDRLLDQAREEVMQEHEGFQFEYGFMSEWDDTPDEQELQVASIEQIYQSIDEYPHAIDKIERFCLPFLRTAGSTVAIKRALQGVHERPHLAYLYLSYLGKLARDNAAVSARMQTILIKNKLPFDYQRLFLLSALYNAANIKPATILKALRLLKDHSVHHAVRGVAAIFAAHHGTPQQKRIVRTTYENESSGYVQAAILYSSRYFPSPERRSCIRAWAGHNFTNTLVAEAVRKSV